MAEALRPQDGLYTLVTRGPEADRTELIASVTAVHDADEHTAWLAYFRSSQLACVTMTVTEAAYRPHYDESEIASLRLDETLPVRSMPARLLAGMIARDRAGLGPVVIMPCDNVPGNGAQTKRLVFGLANRVGRWAEDVVDRTALFADTVVDRITPRATADDARAAFASLGYRDAAPVVTEPFHEWIIEGPLPCAQPRWEQSGAIVTRDVVPYQQRKLLLLNGGHSLLAYVGGLRGHQSIAAACKDPACMDWLNQWWDEASICLDASDSDLAAYRRALLERFGNGRMVHLLSQIAADGSQKLPVRVLPVLQKHRASGREPRAAIEVLAAWVCHLRGHGIASNDVHAKDTDVSGSMSAAVLRLLKLLDPQIVDDVQLVLEIVRRAKAIEWAL